MYLSHEHRGMTLEGVDTHIIIIFIFFAQVINVSVKQHTPEKAIVGLAKAQCMIGIVHFQRYCVGALILL